MNAQIGALWRDARAVELHVLWREVGKILSQRYERSEAEAMARHVLSDTFSLPVFRPYVRVRQNKRRAILLSVRLRRLLAGEPLQYVLGKVYFMGHSLVIGEGALIPRPETEELCQEVLKKMGEKKMRVLDLGTGSGCIALCLASKDAEVTGIDISSLALGYARRNRRRCGLSARQVRFFQRDLLKDPLPKARQGKWYDILVSNPPYVHAEERLPRNVREYEPHRALFAPHPLAFYTAIARIGTQRLRRGGYFFVEINPKDVEEIKSLFSHYGYLDIDSQKDLSDKVRFVMGRAPLSAPFPPLSTSPKE